MRSVLILCCLTLWCTASWGQSKNDLIYQRGKGRATSGAVVDVSPDAITMKVGGKTEVIPVDVITRLMLKDDPAGLGALRSAVTSGQLEQAQNQLKTIKPTGRDIVIQDVAFYGALIDAKLALRGSGSVKSAAGLMGGFLKKYPTSLRYYEACEVMGDLAMSMSRFDAATTFYGKLNAAKSVAIRERAALLQGDAWLRRNETAKAARLFQQASKSTDSRTSSLGSIGLANCMSADGKAEAGIALIERIIKQNDAEDTELFAQAYNALGRLYQATGNSEAALEAFLHTDLLYFRDADAHAEALYHLAGLWSKANKPTDSTKARQVLKQKYATSSWAQK